MPDSILAGNNVAPLGGGMMGTNPLEMLNTLSEIQNRQNQNTAFQLKMKANQAIGEAIASAPSLDEGISNAFIPGAMSWGGEALGNWRAYQGLTATYHGQVAKQAQDGLEMLMRNRGASGVG